MPKRGLFMNIQAIQHSSESKHSFAVDAKTLRVRLRTAADDVTQAEIVYGLKYGFSKKTAKRAVMQKTCSDGLFDWYTFDIVSDDSRLAYIFFLTGTDGEKYYFSEEGATKTYDYKLAYYNFFQKAYINEADIFSPVEWIKNAVVYQIFVDRFNRADDKKNCAYINMKWGDIPTPTSFAGGDIQGIIDRLPYLQSLSVSAIYLTPIFLSKSNHKYDIKDYYEIDPMFGTKKEFATLVERAHAMGMRVVLDAVFNHCSDENALFQDVVKNGRKSKYYDWFIIHGDRPDPRAANYETFGDCAYMPKINTSNPDAQEYLCGVGEYWIKNFGIDGWRLDVSDEVSHEFWRLFRRRVKACGADKALVGENWHDSRPYLRGDEFDSVMNYPFTKAATDFFVNEVTDATGYANALNGILMRNVDSANQMMFNLLDSHDTHRFFSLCNKNKQKLLSALAVNVFFPGASMIYYGTEEAMEGGYDPDSRRCMDWSKASGAFTEKVKRLLTLKRTAAFASGDCTIKSENGVLIMRRSTGKDTVTLYVNNTDKPKSVGGITVDAQSHVVHEVAVNIAGGEVAASNATKQI